MPLSKRHSAFGFYIALQLTAMSASAETEIPWNLQQVNADEAHQAGHTGKGSVVGVIDADLDATHLAFEGRIDARSRTFLSPDDTQLTNPSGHGTYVAGILAAGKGVGPMFGIAYDASVLGLQAISADDPDQDIKTCVRYRLPTADALVYAAELNLKVVNGSYGPRALPSRITKKGFNIKYEVLAHQVLKFNDGVNEVLYMPEYEAIKRAAAADVVLVFAAGNDYQVQPLVARNPSGNGLIPYIRPEHHDSGVYRFISSALTDDENDPKTYAYLESNDPRLASLDLSSLSGQIITVVATNRDGEIASYSNRCGVASQWCIAAPGGDTPHNNEKGILSTTLMSRGAQGYDITSGTSLATALVAGAAAMVREAFPHLDARQTIELLLSTADNSGTYADSATYGRGMLDVGRALRQAGS